MFYPLFNTFDNHARVFSTEPAKECWYTHLEVLAILSRILV